MTKRHSFLNFIRLLGLLLIGGCATLPPHQPDPQTLAQLEKRGETQIADSKIAELKRKLGQLIYINIDGRGYHGDFAVRPGYFRLIRELQPGGVLAHYNSTEFHKIAKTNRRLVTLTRVPLFIGIDYLKLKRPSAHITKGRPLKNYLLLGNGFKRGCLTTYGRLDDPAFKTIIALHAFLLKSAGINQVLGPTVDNSVACEALRKKAVELFRIYDRFKLFPTLKHFPYLPLPSDLHKTSPDTRLSLKQVNRKIRDFKALHTYAQCIMTTHLYNSRIDAENIATFSAKWIGYLKHSLNYNNLIMSDGLFMIKNYTHHPTDCGSLPSPDITLPAHVHPVSIFALKAIIAGHDIVILEGNEHDTYRIFYDLLFFACQNNGTGERLRRRINKAYNKIIHLKRTIRQDLQPIPRPVSRALIREAVYLCSGLMDRLL